MDGWLNFLVGIEFKMACINTLIDFIQQYINSGVETPYKELQC